MYRRTYIETRTQSHAHTHPLHALQRKVHKRTISLSTSVSVLSLYMCPCLPPSLTHTQPHTHTLSLSLLSLSLSHTQTNAPPLSLSHSHTQHTHIHTALHTRALSISLSLAFSYTTHLKWFWCAVNLLCQVAHNDKRRPQTAFAVKIGHALHQDAAQNHTAIVDLKMRKGETGGRLAFFLMPCDTLCCD